MASVSKIKKCKRNNRDAKKLKRRQKKVELRLRKDGVLTLEG